MFSGQATSAKKNLQFSHEAIAFQLREPQFPQRRGTKALLRLNSGTDGAELPNTLSTSTDRHFCRQLRLYSEQAPGKRRDPRGERVAQSRRQPGMGICRCGRRPLEAGVEGEHGGVLHKFQCGREEGKSQIYHPMR